MAVNCQGTPHPIHHLTFQWTIANLSLVFSVLPAFLLTTSVLFFLFLPFAPLLSFAPSSSTFRYQWTPDQSNFDSRFRKLRFGDRSFTRQLATLFGRAREIHFSPLSNNNRTITCWSPMRNIKTMCVARATHGNWLSLLLTAPTPLA